MNPGGQATDYRALLKAGLAKLEALQGQLDESRRARTEPLAVIGLSCRFPGGARDPESYWRLLRDGVDAIQEVPPERWDVDAYYDPDPDVPGKMNTRYGGFLERVDDFDAGFFGITPREAATMDPQHRLLLEACWEALEDAGLAAASMPGSASGVFIGISSTDYVERMKHLGIEGIDAYAGTGNAHSVATGRVSYLLGLQGPNLAVDTACSSSLVAVHLACQSLRNKECDLALAGGVNVILSPEVSINFTKARMLASDGRCKTFDAKADGYVRGEGVGVVVLKRWSDAVRAGDRILALVRGSAVNHDGRTSGLTVPNGPSQERVIRQALANGEVSPPEVAYVEAHGTGTALGDPIEVSALASVYGVGRPASKPLLLGSVKTNIGHLEAASGIAGLIKVILAAERGEIPPHLHFQVPNPHVAWDEIPVQVCAKAVAWPPGSARRLAGVSSFGFSGTNAHVVVEAATANRTDQTDRANRADARPFHLLALSARQSAALRALAQRYIEHLERNPKQSLADIAFTANTGRSHFEHRLALVCASAAEAKGQLEAWLAGGPAAGCFQGEIPRNRQPRLAFVFTGVGPEIPKMGRELYEGNSVFRGTLERCDEMLRSMGWDPLLAAVFGPGGEKWRAEAHRARAAGFGVEMALAELWKSWGVVPSFVTGEGAGETAAACVAGLYSLEDALKALAGGSWSRVAFARPRLALMPSDTGEAGGEGMNEAGYWERKVVEEAGRGTGCERARRQGAEVSLELGLGPVLSSGADSMDEAGQMPILRCGAGAWRPVLESLARLYVLGCPVDWRGWDSLFVRRKVRLPTYPFLRERHWIAGDAARNGRGGDGGRGGGKVAAAPPARPVTGGSRQDGVPGLYEVEWEADEAGGGGGSAMAEAGSWLVFSDRGGRGLALAERLRARGMPCTLVDAGAETSRREAGRFSLDPSRRDDYARVVREAADSGPLPLRGVIHLWGTDCPVETARGEAASDLSELLETGCRSALYALQALVAAERAVPPRFWLVTEGAAAGLESPAAASGVRRIAQGALWGLGRTAALEHPGLWGGLVDLQPGGPESLDAVALVDALLAARGENQVAFRGGRRYVPRLVRRVSPGLRGNGPRLEIRPEATYLVTGGLGGLGRRVAGWLADRGARHLVLVGRSGLGEGDQAWMRVLGERCQAVVERADVSSEEQVAALIDKVEREMPPLRGVIHAAGVFDDSVLWQEEWPRFARVLAPKALGGWNLHRATQGMELDFFVLFSSSASVFGLPGSGNYSAANACLDALAHARRCLGLPALSINWGPWEGVGMAAAGGLKQDARWAAAGIGKMPQETALGALEGLLGSDRAQTAVLSMDWRTFEERLAAPAEARRFLLRIREAGPSLDPMFLGAKDLPEEGLLLKRVLSAAPGDREGIVRNHLRNRIAKVIGLGEERVPLDGSVVALGMDSLMVMELMKDLQAACQLALYPREIYERPGIPALSRYLVSEMERAHGAAAGHAVAGPQESPAADAAGRSGDAAAVPAGRSLIVKTTQPVQSPVAKRVPGVHLVLSSPRAGSTLLRVMLAGHPRLFSPPELHLLPFETMGQRQRELGVSFLGEGLQRAVMELKGLDAAGSRRLLEGWVAGDRSIPETYAALVEMAGGRQVVDKTPTYAARLGTLENAERFLEGAKYVHLVRHPYAVIESFVRMRMDKLAGAAEGDPYALAEEVWAVSNENVLAFFERIEAGRKHVLRYEDLMRGPEEAMRRLCDFLGVGYVPELLTPYEGDRMTDGVHPESAPLSDPNFRTRKRIEPELGDAWRRIVLPRRLSERACGLARKLGYELPREEGVLQPASGESAGPAAPAAEAMRDERVEVRGASLGVCSWGPESGRLVLCVHGILEQGAVWLPIAEILARRGCRVIAPDLRGHGRSDHLPPGASYQLLDFVADLDGLMRRTGEGPAVLVGHSLGAVAAALLALARPRRVGGLVLLEAPAPAAKPEGDWSSRLAAQLDYLASVPEAPRFSSVAEAASRLREAGPAWSEDMALRLAVRATQPCTDGGFTWRWDPRLRTRAGLTFTGPGGLPFLEWLSQIPCPVTLVYGAEGDLAEATKRPEPGSVRRLLLPGGHQVHVESPQAVAEVIAGIAAKP
ncbi:MAG: alpha/beta fold hydrolase [Planctomycetes bacterium]|nr:alpha/beta fold hydrolase [Planctomycetota bacterium]